ncbi:MAG: prepilin-type N-terminal cleavage/methylation domain-containing protein, partial [Phycisphaeraceae bacterium]
MSTHSLNIQGPRRQSRPPRRPGGGAPQAGFSLMEVLVAIGLLALGFVAVAAIFPTGAVMQRETAHDVHTRNLLTNIEATIKGTNLRHEHPDEPHLSLVDNYTHGINVVMGRPFELRTMTDHSPLSAEMAGAVGFWSVGTRTSPASRAPAAAENLDDHLALVQQRPFVWVPLLRNRGGEDENGEFDRQRWRLVVFVLRRHHPASEAAYPFLGPTRLDFLDYPDYPLNHLGD